MKPPDPVICPLSAPTHHTQPPLQKSAPVETESLSSNMGHRLPAGPCDLLIVASSRLVMEPWCLANETGQEGKRRRKGEGCIQMMNISDLKEKTTYEPGIFLPCQHSSRKSLSLMSLLSSIQERCSRTFLTPSSQEEGHW